MASKKTATVSANSNSNASASNGIRYALTPLKSPKKKNKPFSVADIESSNWTTFVIIGYHDGETVHFFTKLKDFFDYAFDHPNDTVFMHFGGIFDFLFLLQELFSSDGRYMLEGVLPRGSGILSMSVTNGERTIIFRDSSALLPFSLKTLAENFGCKTLKGSIDYSKIIGVTDELKKYLKSDLLALHEVLSKFYASPIIKEVGAKTTIASQSLQVLRKYLVKAVPSLPSTIDPFVRESYAGGRTEIFRPVYDGRGGKTLRNYDINSLYPYVMRENTFPVQFSHWSTSLNLEEEGFHEVFVEVAECYVPILWRKTPKFIFPIGRFWGTYSTPELREAIQSGMVKILRHRKSAIFRPSEAIFGSFVTDLYERRINSTSEVDRTIIKLVLNSCYGRCGLNLERETLELDEGQENVTPTFEIKSRGGTVRFAKGTTVLRSFSNPAIASYVTAFARIENYRRLLQLQDDIHYTDTDSFYTPRELPTSKDLGALKLEGEYKQACFLLPKTYVTDKKVSMKGFDKRKVQHFTFDDFQLALEGEMKLRIPTESRMNRLKSAARKGNFLNMSEPSFKQIVSQYDKRLLFRDSRGKWDSRPIKLWENQNDR